MSTQRREPISGITRDLIILDFVHFHRTHNEIVILRGVPLQTVKRVISKYMLRRSEPTGDNYQAKGSQLKLFAA